MNTKKLTIILLVTLLATSIPTQIVHGTSYLETGFFYSTFFGGSSDDRLRDIAMDSEGNIIVTGGTWSDDFPVRNAAQQEYGGGELPPSEYFHLMGDVVVAKFTPDYQLIWSTYLGGTGYELATHVEIDQEDNILIIGHTTSTDFPTTEDVTPTGREDGDPFITIYSPDGELIKSKLFIPDEIDGIEHTDVDSEGNLVVAGTTSSSSMYCSDDAFQSELHGESDGYVRIVTPDLVTVIFSTYIGGNGQEYLGEVDVGADDSIYVSGTTHSTDLPVTPNCIRAEYMGEPYDNFIAKIGPNRNLVTLTYFGGSDIDHVFGLCEGPHGDSIAFVGRTWSTDYPVTDNAYMSEYGAEADGYLTVIDAAGTEVLYSTYYGLEEWDSVLQVNLDDHGKLITTGFVHSGGFETINAFQPDYMGASEAIITIWGEETELNSYLGGYASEHIFAQIVSSGTVYIVGQSQSPEFAVFEDAFQTTHAGGQDGILWTMNYRDYLQGDYAPETTGPDLRPYTSIGVVLSTIVIWFILVRRSFSPEP